MPGKGHNKPQPQAATVTASLVLLETDVHWGDTIHFEVAGDGLFDVRVVVQTDGGLSVSFTNATQGWAVTLGPSPTWPADANGPVGGHATAELEGPPDETTGVQGAPLAITEFEVLP